jgi:uncharacterized protein YeeX (DUF496 family)
MKLYEATESLKQIQEMIDDGVPSEELIDTIELLQIDFLEKAESILYLIKNIDGDVAAIKAEEERLTSIRQVRENRKKSILDYLKRNMSASDIKKIDNGVVSATLGKPRAVAEIDDENLIPMDYKKIKIIASIDKVGLLNALKDGEEIQGARLGQSDYSLTIK